LFAISAEYELIWLLVRFEVERIVCLRCSNLKSASASLLSDLLVKTDESNFGVGALRPACRARLS